MAGIGLTLRKLLADQTYLSGAAAYFSSAVISAGPWLISMISLSLVQGASAAFLTPENAALLFATITYVFVGSSIAAGPVQIVLTRIIADQIFLDETGAIAQTFTRTLIFSLAGLIVVISPFLAWAPFDLVYRLLAGSLFLTITSIWLVLGPLSAAQDFGSIILAFLIGYGVSALASVGLGIQFGLHGSLAGFAAGQTICLALLCQRVYAEFPERKPQQTNLLDRWKEYWSLALIGLFYSIGLWAEKVFYWFSPAATMIGGFYRVFRPYDSSILLAYLLTIPASAVFLINVETRFYQDYRSFYTHILRSRPADGRGPSGGSFDQINQARLAMRTSIWSGFWTLLKVQGIVAAFALLMARDLLRYLGLTGNYLGTLDVAILSAGGQVLVWYALLMLLYLDARMQTLTLASIFAGGNLCLTVLAARLAPGAYGLGYLLATVISALFGLWQLDARLARLDYITFMLQPLEPAAPPRAVPAQNNRMDTPK